MTTTAIASTQKAGEGDATILGNNSNPIAENLLSQSAQQSRQKAQGDLLKSKQIQENQTKFFNNLGGLKEKVWMQDIPEITGDVNALIDKAVQMQKNGINPFDPSNGATYTELYGDIEKLQAKQEASKSAETLFNNSYATFKSNKEGDFDYELTKTKLDSGANKKILERSTDDFGLVYAPVNAMGVLDKTFSDNLKAQFAVAKTYNDKGLTQEANDVIDVIKKSTIPATRQMLDKYVVQGRMTPEEADKTALAYVEQYQQKALFDPTKDEDQAQRKQEHDDLEAWRKKQMAFKWSNLDFQKSLKETTPTYAYDAVDRVFGSGASSKTFSGTPYEDLDLSATDKNGNIIPAMINEVKTIQKQSDGSSIAIVTFKKPIADATGNITFIDYQQGIPYKDARGNPVFQNSTFYKSIQNDAVLNKKSYSNISGQEIGGGKPAVTQKTANTQTGFSKNTTKPKEVKYSTVIEKGITAVMNKNGLTRDEAISALKKAGKIK